MDITEIRRLIFESVRLNPATPVVDRDYTERLKQTADSPKPLKVLTGLRRSGKSVLLIQLYHYLREQGVPAENLFFVNFESDLAVSIRSTAGLRSAFETFVAHANHKHPNYIFLDEIQVVPEWHLLVRSMYDAGRGNIYITGSNGDLLSSEFASVLGGRILEFVVFPFHLRELLVFHGIKHTSHIEQVENASAIERIFSDSLAYGGLVEVQSLAEDQRLSYRTSLIEKIIINDILRRYEIQFPELLRQLVQFLERALSGIVSAASLAKESGRNEQTIALYLGYLSSTLMLCRLNKYQFKAKKLLTTQSKYYFVDNLFAHRADRSAQLENLAFTHLARQHGTANVHFARDERGHEVDLFVTNPATQRKLAVQVCWELNAQNLQREVGSLKLLKDYSDPGEYAYVILYRSTTVDMSKLPEYVCPIEIKDELLNSRSFGLLG